MIARACVLNPNTLHAPCSSHAFNVAWRLRQGKVQTVLIVPNKVDVGDQWLCCSDCSEPQITDADAQVGYCQMDASLASQLKP
jgi:hypothetical protein